MPRPHFVVIIEQFLQNPAKKHMITKPLCLKVKKQQPWTQGHSLTGYNRVPKLHDFKLKQTVQRGRPWCQGQACVCVCVLLLRCRKVCTASVWHDAEGWLALRAHAASSSVLPVALTSPDDEGRPRAASVDVVYMSVHCWLKELKTGFCWCPEMAHFVWVRWKIKAFFLFTGLE